MTPTRVAWTLALSLFATTASAMDPLPASPPIPRDNPMTPAKVELGRKLYFDPRLSASGTVSCNSCHDVLAGSGDGRAMAPGVTGRAGSRSVPPVWNAAFLSVLFWDGRARSLEEQAKQALVSPVEMGMSDHTQVVKRIAETTGREQEFRAVFGEKDPLTIENAARAIAAYERTLITPRSPFDRFKAGDKKALSTPAQRGLKLFQSVGCVSCHSGSLLAGPKLPEGQGFYMKFPLVAGEYATRYRLAEDPGRRSVTQAEVDRNMWRVAPLRNIALTRPYFHNGSVPALDEAVRVMAKTQLGRDLKNEEVADLVAFLEGLTGEFPRQAAPPVPAVPPKEDD